MSLFYRIITGYFIFFSYTLPVFSQQIEIKGKITNEKNEKLVHANVLLVGENEKIMTYAFSNNEGFYKLSINKNVDTYSILFKSLGYLDKKIPLQGKDLSNLNVVLQDNPISLNEVVVVAKQPIRVKNDTTEYSVASFSDEFDRSIEDVLKKMPGIKVEEDGTILFKGKQIEKILLDDTDLFDKKYKLASKNVPAKVVDKVQAIEHYHENKLLKNVEYSDKIILNLTLSDEVSTRSVFGDVSLGGGYEDRYEAKANLFTMNKKLKLYNMTDLNNAAFKTSFSSDENIRMLGSEFDSHADSRVVNHYLSPYNEYAINKAEDKKGFNSLNFNYKPNDKLQLMANLLFNKDQISVFEQEKKFYYDDSLSVVTSSAVTQVPKTFFSKIKLNYKIKDHVQLDYDGVYDWDVNNITNNMLTPESYKHYVSEKNYFLNNKANLTVALKDSAALTFNASLLYNRNNQQFDYLRNFDFFQVIGQGLRANTTEYNASVKYYKKITNSFYYTLMTDIRFNDQDLFSNTLYQEEKNSQNCIGMDYLSTSFNLNLTYSKSISKILLDAKIGYKKQSLSGLDLFSYDNERLEFFPKLAYFITLGKHRFSVFGSYSAGNLSIDDYLKEIFTDYRDENLGADRYGIRNTFSFGGTYLYFSPYSQDFFYFSCTDVRSQNVFASKIDITSTINYTSKLLGYDNNMQLYILSLKKYVDPIRHGIQFENSITSMEYCNAVNSGEIRKNKSLSSASRLSLKSVFDFPLNYTLGALFNFYRFKTDGLPESKASNFSFFQDLTIKAVKKLKIKISFEEYILGKEKKVYFFANSTLSYSLNKPNLGISLMAYNIFNNRYVRDYTVRDYYSDESLLRIRPAQCLLTVGYHF